MASGGSRDALIRSYARATRNQVAFFSEARVCEIARSADEISRIFVKAFEGGRIDCGVYQGPMQLPDNPTEKLFAVLKAGINEKNVLPVELKDFAPCRHKGGIHWQFTLSELQAKTCQAVIISAAKDPNFIVFLPTYYIRRPLLEGRAKDKTTCIYSKPFRPYWTLQQLPAFPPELAPFMIPISSVGQALANMRAFGLRTSDMW